MIDALIVAGIFALGFFESVMLSVGLIVEARGYAAASAFMSAINVLLWFVTVKVAVEISWSLIPIYAAAFGVGSFFAVRWTRKLKMGTK